MLRSSLTFFDCSQCFEICFLGFCQTLNMYDIHALIGPLAYECLKACSRLYIPEFDRSIVAAAGKRMAVRTKCNLPYPVGVTLKRLKAMPGIDIPEANGLIIASAGECNSIRAESDGSHPI